METTEPKFESDIKKISEAIIRFLAMLIWLLMLILTYIIKPFYWIISKIFKK